MNSLKTYISGMFLSLTLLTSAHAVSTQGYTEGTITNITSITEGLLVAVSAGQPFNCVGAPGYPALTNWMLIPEANKTVIALTLLTFAQNKSAPVVVYTNPYTAAQGSFCTVWQVDPQ